MSRLEGLLNVLNSSGISQHLSQIQQGLVLGAMNLLRNRQEDTEPDFYGDRKDRNSIANSIKLMLNSVGPAAAASAVDVTIAHLRQQGKLQNISLNGNYIHNVNAIVQNDEVGELDGFGNVMRQFLLPRYAYLDFDRVVDPRHNIDLECGYPKFITPIMYRYMYDRDDVARRIVDIYPDECWAAVPDVYETEDEKTWTPFELAWRDLCDNRQLLQYLYRLDRLSGIGHYGILLLGVDDGQDLEKPIEEKDLLAGIQNSVSSKQRNLLYMRPFDEYLSFIHMYETDVMSPRYGLPKFYNLVFLDMTIDAAGASIGTRLNRRVHWTRVIHVADNLQSSLVFGIPRQQPVFNRLLDLRKIKGASAEMFWKGGFPGLSFEIDPRFVADEVDFDKETFRKEIRDYADGLSRFLALVGVKATSLAPQIPTDPDKYITLQMQAIAAHAGIPMSILMGSELGKVAAGENRLTWNTRLRRRNAMFTEPYIIRSLINRFVAIGIMPPPSSGRYFVDWDDMNTATDEDKANLALKWTQALSQYVASGVIHFIKPLDYMTMILGLSSRDATMVDEYIQSEGGYDKLKKVDPSQGAGVNGKRQDIAGDGKSDTQDRDTADRQANGMKG